MGHPEHSLSVHTEDRSTGAIHSWAPWPSFKPQAWWQREVLDTGSAVCMATLGGKSDCVG